MASPQQDYFVSWKLRLTVRLEEFGTSRLAAAPKAITKNLDGVKVVRDALEAVRDPVGGGFILVQKGKTAAEIPQQQSRSGDNLTFDFNIVPSAMNWNLNSPRVPSNLDATIKFADCPLDPRIIRACAVDDACFHSRPIALWVRDGSASACVAIQVPSGQATFWTWLDWS